MDLEWLEVAKVHSTMIHFQPLGDSCLHEINKDKIMVWRHSAFFKQTSAKKKNWNHWVILQA